MKRMKNTALSIISIAAFCVSLFIACSQTKKESNTDSTLIQSKNKKIKAQSAEPKKKKLKFISLTENNVVAELTKYGEENKETIVLMKTPKGNMKIKLYENTPLHRANIIRLIKNNFYKDTEFYRVVKDFMIQGGDNDDWSRQTLKNKMGVYTIPAEFRAENIHKKGALSMAREYENNPDMRSVPFEFFIVQGTPYTEGEILGAELQYEIKIKPEHKKIYMTQGGTPHLDGKHTVFGQVIEGIDVIDKIASVKVDEGDWPIEDITIDFEIIK